jgi:hypothetical protein
MTTFVRSGIYGCFMYMMCALLKMLPQFFKEILLPNCIHVITIFVISSQLLERNVVEQLRICTSTINRRSADYKKKVGEM